MKRFILTLAVVLMAVVSAQAQQSNCRRCDGTGVVVCPDCNGKTELCPSCKGLGNIVCRRCHGEFITCPVCHGSKYYNNSSCWTCKGTGRVIDCHQCDGKGYEKCPEAPKNCFYGDKVCPRCDGLKKIPCPDCQ